MYTLSSSETNAPQLYFFHKESTDIAPLKFKSAMYLSNLFLYKATFTVYNQPYLIMNLMLLTYF
jgi:hypothetical protein